MTTVFEAFLGPSDLAVTLAELNVEEMFCDASARDAVDVACPSQLCLMYGDDGAGDTCLL